MGITLPFAVNERTYHGSLRFCMFCGLCGSAMEKDELSKLALQWIIKYGPVFHGLAAKFIFALFQGEQNRLLHRKCAVRIFIHKLQNFRNERVSIANESVSKVLQRVNKIHTKHFLW